MRPNKTDEARGYVFEMRRLLAQRVEDALSFERLDGKHGRYGDRILLRQKPSLHFHRRTCSDNPHAKEDFVLSDCNDNASPGILSFAAEMM